jgi:Zn-dependent peptidase ImmA (M78 family)
LVFQAAGIEVSELRGAAIADPIAPAILVNLHDSYTGRIFTLLHELTHILLGISALTDMGEADSTSPSAQIETFCNKVAAAALMPSDAFIAAFADLQHSLHSQQDVVSRLSTLFRTSREAALHRASEFGLVTPGDAQSLLSEFRRQFAQLRQKARNAVVPWPRKIASRTGRLFLEEVTSAWDNEFLTGGEVSDLLQTKLDHLPKIMHEAGL